MLTKIIKDIENKGLKHVAILTHKYPDYDAICSASALADIIYQEIINHKYPNWNQLSPDEQKEILSRKSDNIVNILPIVEKKNIGEYELSTSKLIKDEKDFDNILQQVSFDAAIVCDVNEQDRVFGGEIVNNLDNESIYLFDHHTGNRKELDILQENKLVLTSSSTCEIILQDAIKEGINIGLKAMRDLYAGIVTDSCNFMFGVNDFTLRVKNNDVYGLNQQEKKKIEDIFNKLYEEDEYNLQNLQKIDNDFPGLNIYYLNNPKVSKERGTYINSAIENAIKPNDNSISVLFAIFNEHIEIKFRKGTKSKIMISELAKSFNGGGKEDRAAARAQGKSLNELIEDLINYLYYLNNQECTCSIESSKIYKK